MEQINYRQRSRMPKKLEWYTETNKAIREILESVGSKRDYEYLKRHCVSKLNQKRQMNKVESINYQKR